MENLSEKTRIGEVGKDKQQRELAGDMNERGKISESLTVDKKIREIEGVKAIGEKEGDFSTMSASLKG